MKKLIGYIRVSTEDQGKSGNGLDAQRVEIQRFADANGYELIEIVEEVASGKLGIEDRPVLANAIKTVTKLKAMIVVSKLDRLSRDAAFILNLMKTKAKFIVVQLGEYVDTFMLHMYAVLAEKERQMISQRTKDALARLKANGKKLGGPKTSEAGAIGRKIASKQADEFAIRLKPSIERMRACGMSLNAIAEEFNGNGTKTVRGGAWTATSVKNVIARWA